MIVRPVLCQSFVGRREELAYLRERRLAAGSSRGGLVLIAGDAGVGKSRLIAEFCGSLAYSRWRIAHGPCLEFARRPYGPVLDVLARLDPAAAPLVAAESKQEQFDAIVDRFAALAARTAILAVIEDVHWADAATLELLAYLGAKLHGLRILVLASLRLDDLHPEHPATIAVAKIIRSAGAGRIDLAPLAGLELKTFIDDALSTVDLPDETRRAVALAGDGNPFFTEELLKSAVALKASRPDDRVRRELPQTIRATLLERLRPFDPQERRVVTQAAVIGRTFGLELLATTLETTTERVLPALRRARDFQLVEEVTATSFRFRHGLTREVIYDDFLGSELRPLHETIAVALEAATGEERSLEALAYHWWAAGDAERSTRYNELAGDAAARVYAYEDAIACYQRALEADGLAPLARGTLVEKIAELRLTLTWTEEARATFGAAADIFTEAGAYEREAGCRANAAILAYTAGLPAPTATLEAMLERLDAGEYVARGRVHLGLAWLAASFWYPTRAEHHLAQIDPRALTVSPDINLRYHNVAAWVAMTVGDVARFRSEHAAWIAGARATGSERLLSSAYANGAMCAAFLCLHEEAADHLQSALRVAADARHRYAQQGAHAIGAICHLLRGDLKSARAAVDSVPATTDNNVQIVNAAAVGTILGAYLDDPALIETWFDGFETAVAASPEIECGGGFAELLVRRGRGREAAALLHRALPDCELPRGSVYTLLAVGRYGDPADRVRARTYLERAAAGANETLERPALALFDAFAHLREGRGDEARRSAGAAAEGFRRLRAPLLEAAALEAAGDPDGALALYRRCGATGEVRRLAPVRTDEPKHPMQDAADAAALSAREREILVLAARGRSNLEIARELAISYKTVEKHLGSVYQKLGLSSRRQLLAFVTADRGTGDSGSPMRQESLKAVR